MPYEQEYMKNLLMIRDYGTIERNERTGIKTARLPSTQISVELAAGFPILLSKKVQWKTAVKEILWIMQKQSNKIEDLDAKIWDAWADKDGTIGRSYGYQVGRKVFRDGRLFESQVHYILETLKEDPSSRQCVIDMWNVQDLGMMQLVPCAYSSVWNVISGRLNCMLVQRSADYPVGVPFDTLQYAVLTHLFARHLGLKPGKLTHVMADSHIYFNQFEGVETQFCQYEELIRMQKPTPRLVIREDAPTDFWKVTLDDIAVVDYEPMPAIKFEVAV